jgi:hypothetical protein
MSIVKWLILFSCIYSSLYSQIVNPKVWIMGYQSPLTDTNSIDTGFYRISGLTKLDFRQNPPLITKILKGLSLSGCNTFIFDKNDSLVLYSNGSKVFNGKHRLIEGADSLNYGKNDWANSSFVDNYFADFYISIYPCSITILPIPDQKNKYALISVFINGDDNTFGRINYSVIDMSLNSGLGKMTKKEITLLEGNFTEALAACRHGNGRDWWIIAREYSNKCYKVFLLDSTGVHLKSSNQCNSWDLSNKNSGRRNFVSKFSWDGRYFATINYKGVELYDFDRCRGELKNRHEIPISTNDSFMNISLCFSKSDRFLYYNSIRTVYQYSLSKKTSIKIGDCKLFFDTVPYRGDTLPVESNFGFSQLGGDDKIYISSTSTSFHLSIIESPDIEGVGCGLKQFNFKVLTNNAGLPNYPNYELGIDTCWRNSVQDLTIDGISLYPNPSSDLIHVSFGNRPSSKIEFVLIDALGREVYRNLSDLNTNVHQIDMKVWSSGIYHLRVLENEKVVYKTQVILSK